MNRIYLQGMGFFKGFDLDGKPQWTRKMHDAKMVDRPKNVCIEIKRAMEQNNLTFEILSSVFINPQ
jgi:hypothetical protein